MELLKLIFYKIYCWQRRFGGGIFDTIIGLSASLSILTETLIISIMLLVGRENFSRTNSNTFFHSLAFHISIPIILTIALLPNRRYYAILLQMHRKYKNKYRWLALVFIVVPVLLLSLIVLFIVIKLKQTH